MARYSKKPNKFLLTVIILAVIAGAIYINFLIRKNSFYSPSQVDSLHPTINASSLQK